MPADQQRPVGRASVPGRSNPSRATAPKRATATYGSTQQRRLRPRWDRIALVAILVVLLCGGLGTAGVWLYAKKKEGDLSRTDPFAMLTAGRPAKAMSGSQNILLVGTDSRDPDAPVDQATEWRADTIIMLHIPSTQDRAYLVSVPRDLWVSVPQDAATSDCGSRRAKINAAFAWGGLPLLVRTVECYSDVHVDHVIVIDFAGFTKVVDALGGVDLNIEQDITSIHPPYRKFAAGTGQFSGAEALDYVRQRYQFPDGDFARMRHQQELLKALLEKAVSSETVTNPAKFNAFIDATTRSLTVNQEFSLIDMALQYRNLRSSDLSFITSPHLGTDTIDGQSVVVSDKPAAIELYDAIAADRMANWFAAHNPSPAPAT